MYRKRSRKEKPIISRNTFIKAYRYLRKDKEKFIMMTYLKICKILSINPWFYRSYQKGIPLRIELGVLNQYAPRTPYQEKFPKPKEKKYSNITIVTPSFKKGRYIEETIKSVLNQNYSKLEFIIQDGGSEDNTLKIIKRYRKKLTSFQSKKDKGQSNAINIGFKRSTGEIMAYLNSDDKLMPGALHFVNDYFHSYPLVDVIYGHRIIIDENDMQIGRWILYKHDSAALQYADFIPQ